MKSPAYSFPSVWDKETEKLQPAEVKTCSDRVVKPEPTYNTLTDKIIAANKFAEENRLLREIQFGLSIDGKLTITILNKDAVAGKDKVSAQELIDELNKAIAGVTRKRIQGNESAMRRILGRSSR